MGSWLFETKCPITWRDSFVRTRAKGSCNTPTRPDGTELNPFRVETCIGLTMKDTSTLESDHCLLAHALRDATTLNLSRPPLGKQHMPQCMKGCEADLCNVSKIAIEALHLPSNHTEGSKANTQRGSPTLSWRNQRLQPTKTCMKLNAAILRNVVRRNAELQALPSPRRTGVEVFTTPSLKVCAQPSFTSMINSGNAKL